jgi:hypothetical protein
MLISLQRHGQVFKVPKRTESDFNKWKGRLSSAQIEAIEAEINKKIDVKGADIHTAGWMPGKDWAGTPFQPIYEVACLHSFDDAAKCFGLFVYEVFINRPEMWYVGRFELDHKEITSNTYFRSRSDAKVETESKKADPA